MEHTELFKLIITGKSVVAEPRQRDLWVGVGFLTYYETELVMR